MENIAYHIPALLVPTIDGVVGCTDGTYIDATFGGGGHSRELLSRLSTDGRLFSFDQDKDAFLNKIDDPRFCLVHSNFRYLKNFMRYYGVSQIDGLIADLGVSFHHFDSAERGFSFRFDGPLDMRMNRDSGITAADVVNTYDEQRLCRVLQLYGELPNARQIAATLVRSRQRQPVLTTEQLAEILEPVCRKDKEKKTLTCVFQALRIEVNDELGALRQLLETSLELLTSGGRIAILTYHSLEDRIVKNFFKSGNIEGQITKDFYGNKQCPFKLVNNKPIVPSEEEIAQNPRARSAKLRIAEKLTC